jgi:hypothetical protein
VQLQTFYDQSTLVRDSIASVRDAILIGLVLARLFWCSSCATGAVRWWRAGDSGDHRDYADRACVCLGQSFNLMTLGGLAAAVGLVIDDAIVVVENIVLHRDSGQSRGRGDPQRAARNREAAGRLDRHADRGVSSADHHHGRDGTFSSARWRSRWESRCSRLWRWR